MVHRWIAGAIVLALMGGALTACGGDDDKTIDLGDGNEVTVGDDLPDEWPDDFPVYDGADLQGAARGEQEGIEGIVATWTTGDNVDDVTAFYDKEFEDGPWTVTTEGNAGGSAYWAVENEDKSKAAYVAVSGGDETTIFVTLGDNPDQSSSGDDGSGDDGSGDDGSGDDGSGDGGSGDGGSTELPAEVDLPDGFPDNVPLTDDAHVSTANTITTGGITMITVGYYTKESIEDVGSFYKDELEDQGFTQSVQTSDGSGVYAAYSENADGTGQTVILSATEDADVEGYQQVVLQVSEGS